MKRVVHPELLDQLPPDDPEAKASRRDLRRINAWMGNGRWLGKVLRQRVGKDDHLLELGAGDGGLARQLLADWDRAPQWTGFDLAPRPEGWKEGWIQGNLLNPGLWPQAAVIVANLVLHHFHEGELRLLGSCLPASARLLVFNEPARREAHLWQTGLLPLLGANRVTRHDAPVSVRAGFAGQELAEMLGLAREQWRVQVDMTMWGAYRLRAEHR